MPCVISSLERSTSVSSIRRMKTPLCFRANSQSNRAVLAPPTCRYPVGEGAKRTRTGALWLTGSISVKPRQLLAQLLYLDRRSGDGSDPWRKDRRYCLRLSPFLRALLDFRYADNDAVRSAFHRIYRVRKGTPRPGLIAWCPAHLQDC